MDLSTATAEEIAAWQAALGPLAWSRYIPHTPFVQQLLFLWLPHRQALYGGGTKGGKSDCLLMAALQYVDVPGYAALIIRRTFKQLSKPDMLIPRSHEWLDNTGAHWDGELYEWTFPSGAKLAFGYVEHDGDEQNYQGAGYQFIGWDELTQYPTDTAYRYLFSRQTRPSSGPLAAVPLRTRATANPGGPGEEWVMERFLGKAAAQAGRIFIPALLGDNPHVDHAEIRANLAELDDVTRAQLELGQWGIRAQGDLFDVDQVRVLDRPPTAGVIGRWRPWDKAATEGGGAYTVGLRLARVEKARYGVEYVVEDMVRGQWASGKREQIIAAVAGLEAILPSWGVDLPMIDDGTVTVLIEQEPGSGGKESALATVARLAARRVKVVRPTSAKQERWGAYAAQINTGNYALVRGPWNAAWFAEHRAAPYGVRKDIPDTGAMGHNEAALARPSTARPVAHAAPPLTAHAGYRPGG